MEVKSIAKVKYSYDLDGISLSALSTSNVVKTEVRKFNLLVKKLSSVEYYQKGDIITYFLVISNNGNYKNTNVIISDFLSKQEVIENSIKVMSLQNNNINYNHFIENDNLLFTINEVCSSEVIIITYKIKATSSTIDSLVTIKSNETNEEEIKSNSLKEGFANIECIKSVSDDITFLNTDLTYVLNLTNNGNITAYNVEVYDELPITFKLNSYNPVTINNNAFNYQIENNIIKLLIPQIEANSKLEILINGKIVS